MKKINGNLQNAISQIKTVIQNLLLEKNPIVVAFDGGSGAGKSTISSLVVENFSDIVLIPLDDFYSANITDSQWDKFSVKEKLENVFNWEKLRNDVIRPLLIGKTAKWFSFDFEQKNPDGSYEMQTEPNERFPAKVILLEGAYSASPIIADLIDLKILIDVPVEERHKRLAFRDDKIFLEQWHARWDMVENYYFTQIRSQKSFDLIIKVS